LSRIAKWVGEERINEMRGSGIGERYQERKAAYRRLIQQPHARIQKPNRAKRVLDKMQAMMPKKKAIRKSEGKKSRAPGVQVNVPAASRFAQAVSDKESQKKQGPAEKKLKQDEEQNGKRTVKKHRVPVRGALAPETELSQSSSFGRGTRPALDCSRRGPVPEYHDPFE